MTGLVTQAHMTRRPIAGHAKKLLPLISSVCVLLVTACSHTPEPPTLPSVSRSEPVGQLPSSMPAANPTEAEIPQNNTAVNPIALPKTANNDEVARLRSENYVLFSAGSDKINDKGMIHLRRHAARLKATPSLIVTLIAYVSPLGSRSYNLAIAEHRLKAVVGVLRSLGVRKQQIRKVNAGSRVLPDECRNESCRLDLRRIELVYGNAD